MNLEEYPPDAPPRSTPKAEFVGVLQDVRVWYDPKCVEYWFHLPGVCNAWCPVGQCPTRSELAAAYPLAVAHQHLVL